MTPRQMTEPEAWREVARRWVEREEGDTYGSCPVFAWMYNRREIGEDTYNKMVTRMECHLLNRELAYGTFSEVDRNPDAYVERYREARALAALWLALEAEE